MFFDKQQMLFFVYFDHLLYFKIQLKLSIYYMCFFYYQINLLAILCMFHFWCERGGLGTILSEFFFKKAESVDTD
jgi:hypothetical protein